MHSLSNSLGYFFLQFLVVVTCVTKTCHSANSLNITECGKTRGCMYYRHENKDFSVSYTFLPVEDQMNENNTVFPIILFELGGQTDGYVAIGISKDKKMGTDEVYACYKKGDKAYFSSFYNDQPYLPPVPLNPTPSLTEINSYKDGVLACQFVIGESYGGKKVSQHGGVHLLLAYGTFNINAGLPEKHVVTPLVSSNMLDKDMFMHEECEVASGVCTSLLKELSQADNSGRQPSYSSVQIFTSMLVLLLLGKYI